MGSRSPPLTVKLTFDPALLKAYDTHPLAALKLLHAQFCSSQELPMRLSSGR